MKALTLVYTQQVETAKQVETAMARVHAVRTGYLVHQVLSGYLASLLPVKLLFL